MLRILKLTGLLLMAGTAQIFAQTEGETAPGFAVELLGGKTFNLADHQGKVVFIFFFGNGCPSCRAFGPDVESSIYQEFKDDSVHFTAVGIDTWNSSSNETSVKGFKAITGITFPLGIKGGDVAVSYQTTYDRLMVIDKDGILVHKGVVIAGNDIDNAKEAIVQSLSVTGVNVLKSEEHPYVYPNPVTDVLYISNRQEAISGVTLFDLSGKKVMEAVLLPVKETSDFKIKVNHLEPGIYFYSLRTEGLTFAGKLVIQK